MNMNEQVVTFTATTSTLKQRIDVDAIMHAVGKGKYWHRWMPTMNPPAAANGWADEANKLALTKKGNLHLKGECHLLATQT